MAYTADIAALNPSHHFKFNGNATDEIASLTSTDTSMIWTNSAISEDSTNSMTSNAVTDLLELNDSNNINDQLHRTLIAGWFRVSKIQQPPTRIYGDGGISNSLAIHLGFGNQILFEVDAADFTLQIYGDTPLVKNRNYHLAIRFESSTYGNIFKGYLDGVNQTDTTDNTPGNVLGSNRGRGAFGGKSSGLAIGGAPLKIVTPVNGRYNHWVFFANANVTSVSDTEIREELFEKGALADTTITNQTGLDALADTVRPNVPLCIRVTGNGTINLSADNVTFDPLASIHVQYTGTGTLNWTNTNGANASIGSTTSTGTINFINPVVFTINNLETGSQVSIFDDEVSNYANFDTRLQYTASSGTSVTYSHSGNSNDIVVEVIKTGFKEIIQKYTINSVHQILTLAQEKETN